MVENRVPAFYYAHWGALTTPEVVLAGPDDTLTYVRDLESHDGLLDTRWAEGGILVDLDTRTLIFYGGSDIQIMPHLRRMLLPLLRRVWHGWSIEYARFGTADFARHLGIDSATVLGGDPRGDARELTLDEFRVTHSVEAALETCLITVTRPDGSVSDYRSGYYARTIAALGPAILPILEQRASVDFPHEGAETEYGIYTEYGVYIDARTKVLWLWDCSELDPRWLEGIEQAWPGWRVEGHIDGVVRQAMLSGRDPLPFMVPDAEVARQLVTVLSSGWSVDPGSLFALATSDPPPGTDRIEVAAGFLRNDPPPTPPDARKALLEQILAGVLASE